MLTEDDPDFENWDQDVTAEDDAYDGQDPALVTADLAQAAELLSQQLAAVTRAQWERTGLRSDGSRFTVESIARYMIHDPVHHAWDVARITGRAPA